MPSLPFTNSKATPYKVALLLYLLPPSGAIIPVRGDTNQGRRDISQLQSLDSLFTEKKRELQTAIGNLQLKEVKDDKAFKATVERLKKRFHLEPVTIGEPAIAANRMVTKQVPAHYDNLRGGPQDFHEVTVAFPFTGSAEVLRYRAGGSLTMDVFYQPTGARIDIEVQMAKLDKAQAIARAKQDMKSTVQLMELNNPFIQHWSAQTPALIDQLAGEKRKELIDLYS